MLGVTAVDLQADKPEPKRGAGVPSRPKIKRFKLGQCVISTLILTSVFRVANYSGGIFIPLSSSVELGQTLDPLDGRLTAASLSFAT
jgi:hypothetical protein